MIVSPRRAAPRSRLSVSLFLVFALATFGPPVSASAAADASIAGTLVDPAGAVVEGATMTLTTDAGLVSTTRTDASGRFDVGRLAPGSYELRMAYPGLTTEPVTVVLAEGEHRTVALTSRLSALSDVLVVTAHQVETPLTATPAAITVFESTDLEARQSETTSDLLRLVPGLSVAASGGRGALTSVFPRGGESDYTLVLVDGVRVNSMGGGFDFAWLPIAGIERVEVVRGPQSAVYGADAIGGVVQVISRSGGPIRLAGLGEGGSHGTSRLTSTFSGSRGAWSWGATGERAASDNFNGTTTASGERVSNDDSESRIGAVHTRFLSPAWSLASQARLVKSERGFPGPFGSDPNGTFGGLDLVARGWNDHRTVGVQATATASPRLRVRAEGSYADLEGRFASAFGDSFSDTRRLTTRGQADVVVSDALSLTAGAEYLGERGRSTFITGLSPDPLPIERRVTGAFVEARGSFARRLTVAAGVRVEHIERSALERSDNPGALRPAFGTDAVVSVNPRVSASWTLHASDDAGTWTRARVNAGTGIRPPDAFEIAFTDNPDLAPERSRSVDAGLEQGLLAGRAIVDATWFDNRYDDLIVAVGRAYQDASRYRTDNIANARARGLEVGLSLRPQVWLSVRAAYTFLDSQILAVDGTSGRAPSPFDPGDALIRRPRHQGWAEAVVTHRRASAFARFGARGRALDIDPSFGAFGGKVEAPGFASADAGASVTIWRDVAVFGRVTNLTDRRYEEVLGFPAAGRTVIGGVRIAAGR